MTKIVRYIVVAKAKEKRCVNLAPRQKADHCVKKGPNDGL